MKGTDVCVGCALCQPVCPTFQETREEGASARGKVSIIEALADQRIRPDDPELARQLSLCTSCWACEAACPAGVATKDLFLEARRRRRSTPMESVLEAILLFCYGSPRRARALLPLLFLPLRGFRLLAKPPEESTAGEGGVVHFPGCLARYAAPDACAGSARRLARLHPGFGEAPPGLCCGAPLINNGLQPRLALTAAPLIAWAERRLPDTIATPDATCAEALKDLAGHLPRALADRWRPFASKVALLQDMDPGFPPGDALQPSCHRLNSREGTAENICCGFGGSLLFLNPRLSSALGRKRLEDLGGSVVLVEGPGCLAHLRRLLPRSQQGRIRHWTA